MSRDVWPSSQSKSAKFVASGIRASTRSYLDCATQYKRRCNQYSALLTIHLYLRPISAYLGVRSPPTRPDRPLQRIPCIASKFIRPHKKGGSMRHIAKMCEADRPWKAASDGGSCLFSLIAVHSRLFTGEHGAHSGSGDRPDRRRGGGGERHGPGYAARHDANAYDRCRGRIQRAGTDSGDLQRQGRRFKGSGKRSGTTSWWRSARSTESTSRCSRASRPRRSRSPRRCHWWKRRTRCWAAPSAIN